MIHLPDMQGGGKLMLLKMGIRFMCILKLRIEVKMEK